MKVNLYRIIKDSPQQRIFNYTSVRRWSTYVDPLKDGISENYMYKIMSFTEFLVNIEVIVGIYKGGHDFTKISELFKK